MAQRKVSTVAIQPTSSAFQPVAEWPEPTGSYYNRPWRGYVYAFGYTYQREAQFIRVARISSVEAGLAWIEQNALDGTFTITDVSGNEYDRVTVNGSPAS